MTNNDWQPQHKYDVHHKRTVRNNKSHQRNGFKNLQLTINIQRCNLSKEKHHESKKWCGNWNLNVQWPPPTNHLKLTTDWHEQKYATVIDFKCTRMRTYQTNTSYLTKMHVTQISDPHQPMSASTKIILSLGERSRRVALRAPWRPAAPCLSPLCASTDF